MTIPVVTELEMTCASYPAQWQGRLADGRYLYIRYRHGELTAGIGKHRDDAVLVSMGLTDGKSAIYSFVDVSDGETDLPTVAEYLREFVDLSAFSGENAA